MCGIAGFLTPRGFGTDSATEIVMNMTQSLVHREWA
jgi:asparagine synthetase B (glutamine-hydrolysing)